MTHLKRLSLAQDKYDAVVKAVEKDLSDKINFDFSIQYQYTDGWTIVSEDSDVAPFKLCVVIIARNGSLTKDKFKSICI